MSGKGTAACEFARLMAVREPVAIAKCYANFSAHSEYTKPSRMPYGTPYPDEGEIHQRLLAAP